MKKFGDTSHSANKLYSVWIRKMIGHPAKIINSLSNHRNMGPCKNLGFGVLSLCR